MYRHQMTHEDRIISVESSLAHIEQTIESLNETIIQQDKTIQNLQTQITRLTTSAQFDEIEKIKGTIKKPPHHQ
ncbi:MAG: hypothetical protein CMO77_03575 [Verrucomicrobiales bacterium]|nr:hypothetical protein [Verrucomicrobiales bacterium]|tara:strand:- start:243 stop:464 length:222 start_codon:yes stop_codon:yes gene_type:complete